MDSHEGSMQIDINERYIIAKGSELSDEIKKEMTRVWRAAFKLSFFENLSFSENDIFCISGEVSTFKVYAFLQAKKTGFDTEISNFCSDPEYKGFKLGTDLLKYFLQNFESSTFSLSVVLVKDIFDESFVWDVDVEQRLKLYSRLGFLIKDVRIKGALASLVLVKITDEFYDFSNENQIIFQNFTTDIGKFTTVKSSNYVVISFPRVYQLQDFVNLFSKNCLNPSLMNQVIYSCQVKLLIKHKKMNASRFMFYWVDYIRNNPDVIITPILDLAPPQIFFIQPFSSEFEAIVDDLKKTYPDLKVIVPLSIVKDEYLNAVTFLMKLGLQYKFDSSFMGCNNVNFDSLFFERNSDWPLLTHETANQIYNKHFQKFEGEFNVEYEISKSELQFLKTFLDKDIEYGGTLRPIKVANTSFLINGGQIVKGTEHNVSPPNDEVNFHVHTKYCNSKYKLLVSWPSGLDFKSIANLSSGISSFKLHLLISEHGIYFIKVSWPFRQLLSSLSEVCKQALYDLILAYFAGLEQLRKVNNIDKLGFLKDYPKQEVEKIKKEIENQINHPDTCFLNFSKIVFELGQSFIDKVNTMRFGDLLKADEFIFATEEEDKKQFIKSQIEQFYKKISQFSSCPDLINKAAKDNIPLFIVKFADWKTMLSGQSFKFS